MKQPRGTGSLRPRETQDDRSRDHRPGHRLHQAQGKWRRSHFFTFLSYTQTHEPVDPHPDYYGKTGNGSFADVLAQTDDYVGEVSWIRSMSLALKEEHDGHLYVRQWARRCTEVVRFHRPVAKRYVFSPTKVRLPSTVPDPLARERSPAEQVSNEVVHQIDLFPTVASIIGADLPTDRVYRRMLTRSDFLMGRYREVSLESLWLSTSAMCSFGVKWRNWKLLLREIDEETYAIQGDGIPFSLQLCSSIRKKRCRSSITSTTPGWIFRCTRFSRITRHLSRKI